MATGTAAIRRQTKRLRPERETRRGGHLTHIFQGMSQFDTLPPVSSVCPKENRIAILDHCGKNAKKTIFCPSALV